MLRRPPDGVWREIAAKEGCERDKEKKKYGEELNQISYSPVNFNGFLTPDLLYRTGTCF
jgi:hypothetical protein